jgi:hypothetical protein
VKAASALLARSSINNPANTPPPRFAGRAVLV